MAKQGSKDPFYSSREWKAARFRVLHRDRYRCVKCGESVKGKGKARVDHIRPRRQYPELSLHLPNIRTLCVSCDNQRHREKGYRNEHIEPVRMDGAPAGWFDDCE